MSKVQEIIKIAQEPVSLESPIGEEEDSHLGDFIPDDDTPSPAEATSTNILREELDIDSDRIYVTYEEIGFWGWNGGNF